MRGGSIPRYIYSTGFFADIAIARNVGWGAWGVGVLRTPYISLLNSPVRKRNLQRGDKKEGPKFTQILSDTFALDDLKTSRETQCGKDVNWCRRKHESRLQAFLLMEHKANRFDIHFRISSLFFFFFYSSSVMVC